MLASTRRDLDRMVQEGRFRDDLFFRLVIGRVELPPLRDRRGDVSLLVDRFWRDLGGGEAGPPPNVRAAWTEYPWPGNVRELYGAVVRQIALGESDDIVGLLTAPAPAKDAPSARPPATSSPTSSRTGSPSPGRAGRSSTTSSADTSRACSREHERCNVSRAASASGVARRYFQLLRSGR